jgi:hypothetical protein
MTERGECPKHKVYEDIVKQTQIDDITYEQVFRCGFKNRIKKMPEIKEKPIEITGKPDAKVIKVKTVGNTPIFVTDSSGTSVTSGSIQVTMVGNNVTGGDIHFSPTFSYNIKIDSNTNTTFNNIQNILSMIDKDYTLTAEEREKGKDTLTKITDLMSATGSTATKLAVYLPLIANIFH